MRRNRAFVTATMTAALLAGGSGVAWAGDLPGGSDDDHHHHKKHHSGGHDDGDDHKHPRDPGGGGGQCSPLDPLPHSTTYGYTGGEQTFHVPGGVSRLRITAIGAAGGVDRLQADSGRGGRGATVSGSVSVTPGSTVYVEVGGIGSSVDADAPGAGQNGFNGGGSGYQGGGGGGGSDVRKVSGGSDPASSDPDTTSLESRLIVAGAGGGAVRDRSGGDAGQAGEGQAPGQAGTQTGGGAGGGNNAGDGRLGHGGAGSTVTVQGGGGGGFYGGGGGNQNSSGGGGSSLVPAGGTMGLTTEAASVTITYTCLLNGIIP